MKIDLQLFGTGSSPGGRGGGGGAGVANAVPTPYQLAEQYFNDKEKHEDMKAYGSTWHVIKEAAQEERAYDKALRKAQVAAAKSLFGWNEEMLDATREQFKEAVNRASEARQKYGPDSYAYERANSVVSLLQNDLQKISSVKPSGVEENRDYSAFVVYRDGTAKQYSPGELSKINTRATPLYVQMATGDGMNDSLGFSTGNHESSMVREADYYHSGQGDTYMDYTEGVISHFEKQLGKKIDW